MNRLIICGSPRIDGRCGALSNTLFEACIAEFLEDEVALVPVSELSISGCIGCEGCNALVAGAEGEPDELVRCTIEDDMDDVYEKIEAADELIVVSPVYFSGPPSQLKALLDRLQPYYQKTAEERKAARERGEHFFTGVKPATLHVVGDGGSPQGYDALVSIVQATLAVAGFRLETIVDWIGKLSPEGDILEEAEMFALAADIHVEGEDEGDDAPDERPVLHFEDNQVVQANPEPALKVQPKPKSPSKPKSPRKPKSQGQPKLAAKPAAAQKQQGKKQGSAKPRGKKPSGKGANAHGSTAKKQNGRSRG